MILFDSSKNRFDSNAVYVKAGWRDEYEDRWIFEGNSIDFSTILRWGNYDENLEKRIELVFEMISYINKKGKPLAVSCCYGSIPVRNLKPGRHYVDLKGG